METKRHQSAHSGTESPEKVPNYVRQAFMGAPQDAGRAMPETKAVPLTSIAVAIHRLRALRPDKVDALAQSMADQCLLQPTAALIERL
jgi:hypothetical protein